MKLAHVVVGAVLLVVVAQCGDDSDVVPGTREASSEPSRPSPSASPSAGRGADDGTAVAALGLLPVKGRAPMTGYDRERFGPAWLDADRNGCDTRNDILGERLRAVTLESNGCVVAAGSYDDPYTGSTIDYWQGHGSPIDIDHIVSMGNAWATGAFSWPIEKRAAFANDPLNLLPTDAGANRQKGDGDAATWLPANKPYRCEYVSRRASPSRLGRERVGARLCVAGPRIDSTAVRLRLYAALGRTHVADLEVERRGRWGLRSPATRR